MGFILIKEQYFFISIYQYINTGKKVFLFLKILLLKWRKDFVRAVD